MLALHLGWDFTDDGTLGQERFKNGGQWYELGIANIDL